MWCEKDCVCVVMDCVWVRGTCLREGDCKYSSGTVWGSGNLFRGRGYKELKEGNELRMGSLHSVSGKVLYRVLVRGCTVSGKGIYYVCMGLERLSGGGGTESDG